MRQKFPLTMQDERLMKQQLKSLHIHRLPMLIILSCLFLPFPFLFLLLNPVVALLALLASWGLVISKWYGFMTVRAKRSQDLASGEKEVLQGTVSRKERHTEVSQKHSSRSRGGVGKRRSGRGSRSSTTTTIEYSYSLYLWDEQKQEEVGLPVFLDDFRAFKEGDEVEAMLGSISGYVYQVKPIHEHRELSVAQEEEPEKLLRERDLKAYEKRSIWEGFLAAAGLAFFIFTVLTLIALGVASMLQHKRGLLEGTSSMIIGGLGMLAWLVFVGGFAWSNMRDSLHGKALVYELVLEDIVEETGNKTAGFFTLTFSNGKEIVIQKSDAGCFQRGKKYLLHQGKYSRVPLAIEIGELEKLIRL